MIRWRDPPQDINVAPRGVLERSVADSVSFVSMELGVNTTSAQRNRSAPTVMMFPSGILKILSLTELPAQDFRPVSWSKATNF